MAANCADRVLFSGKGVRLASRIARRKQVGRLLVTTGLAAAVNLFGASQAWADQGYLPILAGPVVGGVSGVPVHLSGFMDIVPGPSMAIVAAEVTGFQTVGGDGSGGGAGLGGALFVGTGAIVTITSSSFTNNVAIGGNGGNGSIYGGSLNGGGIPSGVIGTTAHIPGIPGLPGITPYGQSDQYVFGDGNGNGLDGWGGARGLSASLIPFVQGGQGGTGGAGQSGWATNPVRIQAVTDATQALAIETQNAGIAAAQQTISIMLQTADAIQLTAATVAAAAAAVNAANPLDTASAVVMVAKFTAEIGALSTIVAADALQLTNDAAAIAAASQSVTLATTQLTNATQSLTSWLAGQAAGIYSNGGEGGTGGQGGAGGFGASGGPGGDGGTGGIGFNPVHVEADGGDGGNAGISGFGAGGAQGGNGGFAGALGVAGGERGAAGAGGIAGFGGGAGSSGTGLGVDLPTGGGGGSGLGGAIFVQSGGTVFINGISSFMGNSTVAGVSLNGGLSGAAAGNSIFLQGASNLIFGALPTDVTTFIGPQSIADNSAIGVGGLGNGSVTVASGALVMAPGTSNQYAGTTTVGSFLNPLGIPGALSAVLRANDGDGLPTSSQLIFTNGGILETNQDFNRYVGTNPTSVTWNGSGGFAYWNGVVTADGSVPSAVPGNLNVTLSGNQPLFWGAFGFVPVGSALVFGAKDATGSVTFTNDIFTGLAGILPLTTVNITVVRNDAQANVLEPGLSIAENIDYLKYTGSIIGLGGVSFNDLFNDGTIYLLNNNYYVGPTFLNNGLLALQGDGSIAPTMVLTITSDTAVFDITQTKNGTSVGGLSGGGTVRMGDKDFAVTAALGPLFANYGGNIEGTANFTVAGGYQQLSGQNTYIGVTTIADNATLGLSDTGSILTSAGVVNNGLFDISATTAGAAIQTLSGHGLVALGDQTLELVNAHGTFSGAINGTGGLIVSGGSEVLTGTNGYTGNTTIKSGTTLTLADGGSIANSNTVQADGTLDIAGTTAGASLVSLSGTGSVVLGDRDLTLSNAHDRFDGVVSDAGGVTVSGGVQVLGGVNTYTGATKVDAGAVLALSDGGAIAVSSGVTANGLFDISTTTAGASITSLSGNGIVNLGDKGLAITGSSGDFSGQVVGAGTLTVSGGTQTLSGLNGYAGLTTVNQAATLALSGDGQIATSAGVVANGLFDIAATNTAAFITTLSGSGQVDLGSRLLVLTNAADTFSGVIAGPSGGALLIAAGTATLTGANTYTGATGIASGASLMLSDAGSIGQSAQVYNDGVLDISGTTTGTAITTLAGAGTVALGARTLTVTAGSDTFGGVIAGEGGLLISGGAQTLSGVNTFTGAATVDSGAALALSAAGRIATAAGVTADGTFDISGADGNVNIRTLAGSGQVALGANALVLTAANGTFSGAIDGAGGVAVLNGAETLTGTSTYTGGTFVGNATLTVNADAALGAVSGKLTLADAKLTVTNGYSTARALELQNIGGIVDTHGQTLGLSGTISGVGQLTADGGGRLDLTGSNSYAGGTTIINKTTVAINDNAALGDAAGAVRILDGTLLLLSDLASNRAFYIGNNSSINSGSFIADLSGPIYLESQNWAPLFTPGISATGGTIGLTPTLLTLGSTATLSGSGTISMPTVVNGTLAPGNSPGTMFFASSLTLGSSGQFSLDIDGTDTGTGAGSFDRIGVTGAFTAAGTLAPKLRDITGSANNTFTPQIGQSFVVVSADGGVAGSFAGMVQPVSGLLEGSRFDALYTSNALTLYAVPVTYTNLRPFEVELSANQVATAASLDGMRPVPGVRANAAVTDALASIYALSVDGIPAQLDHLAATGYGDALMAAADTARRTGDLIEDQIAVRRGDAEALGAAIVSKGTLTYWASGLGGTYKARNSGQTSFNAKRGGVMIGVDKQLYDDTVVGVAVSYSTDKVRSPSLGSVIDTDQVAVSGYMSWTDNAFYVDNRVGVTRLHYSSQRNLYAIARSAKGEGNGWGVNGSTTIGYRKAVGGIDLMPEASAQAAIVNRADIDEANNTAVALGVASDTLASVRTKLGLRTEGRFGVGAASHATISLRAHWAHEFGDKVTTTTANFVEAVASPMRVTSVRHDRDTALLGGGITVSLPHHLSLWVRYTAELGDNTRSNNAMGGLRWVW